MLLRMLSACYPCSRLNDQFDTPMRFWDSGPIWWNNCGLWLGPTVIASLHSAPSLSKMVALLLVTCGNSTLLSATAWRLNRNSSALLSPFANFVPCGMRMAQMDRWLLLGLAEIVFWQIYLESFFTFTSKTKKILPQNTKSIILTIYPPS